MTGYLWSSVTILKICVGLLGSTRVTLEKKTNGFLGCWYRREIAEVGLQFT